jgi:hypothetical protein
MTVQPICLERKRRSFHVAIAFGILIVAILLTAACTTTLSLGNRTTTVTRTPVSPAIEKSIVPFYKVMISQPEGIHPDYVKMDSDVYVQGEIVKFSIVNKGSSSLACQWMPSYNLYRQVGTWESLTSFTGNYRIDDYYWLETGNSTPVQQLSTTNLIPGHYKIVKCGVSREFEIRAAPAITTNSH